MGPGVQRNLPRFCTDLLVQGGLNRLLLTCQASVRLVLVYRKICGKGPVHRLSPSLPLFPSQCCRSSFQAPPRLTDPFLATFQAANLQELQWLSIAIPGRHVHEITASLHCELKSELEQALLVTPAAAERSNATVVRLANDAPYRKSPALVGGFAIGVSPRQPRMERIRR